MSNQQVGEDEYLAGLTGELRRRGSGKLKAPGATECGPGGFRTIGISREMVELSGIEPLTSSQEMLSISACLRFATVVGNFHQLFD